MKIPFIGRDKKRGHNASDTNHVNDVNRDGNSSRVGDISDEVFAQQSSTPNLTAYAQPTKLKTVDENDGLDDKQEPKDPFIKGVYNRVKKEGNLNGLIDALLDLPEKRITKRMNKILSDNPHITASELAEEMADIYIRQSGISSGAVGAAAAAPGVGTAVAAGVTLAEFVIFAAESTFYIISVSQLCGVRTDDKERRRALVLSALMGDEGAKLVSDQLGISTIQWARKSLTTMTSPTLGAVNKMLMKYTRKTFAKRMSGRFFGKLIPFGIGAAVGWFSGRSIAKNVIEGTRAALGDPQDIPATNILALKDK